MTDKLLMWPLLQGGGAMLMRTGLLTGTRTLAAATATRMGAVALASHQILLQVNSPPLILTLATSRSTATCAVVDLPGTRNL